MFLAYGLHLVLKCLVAVEVSRRLSEDRQSGALELLLVTPLPVADIAKGQVAGIWQTFRWQLLALAWVNLALLVFGLGEIRMASKEMPLLLLVMLGGIVMLFLDCYALTRVGMWMALTKKRHAKAFMATILRVMLPAWLAVVLMVFLGFAGAFNGGPDALTGMVFFWFFIGAFIDVVQATMTADHLRKHFREVVSSGRLETSPPGMTLPSVTRPINS